MFLDMNFRLGQKVLKDCVIHFFFLFHRIHFNAPVCLAFRGILPAEGKCRHTLPFRWSLTACSTSVTSLLIRCDYCLWRKGKFVCCVGRGCPLALRQPSPVGYHLASRLCSTVARILEHEVIGIT